MVVRGRRSILSAVAGLVGATLLTGCSGTEPGTAQARASTASVAAPASQSSAPSASDSPPMSGLEKQKALFARLKIPSSSLSVEKLQQWKDPNALDLLVGVDGGIGLWPEVEDDLSTHGRSLGQMQPEDFAEILDRYERYVTGTYLDVKDGKVVDLPVSELMLSEGWFREALSDDALNNYRKDAAGMPDQQIVAGMFVSNALDAVALQTAGKLIEAEGRVGAYWQEHPDQTQRLSEVSSVGALETSFAQQLSYEYIKSRQALAERMAGGDYAANALPNWADCRVARHHWLRYKSADGKDELTVLGAGIVGTFQGSGQLFAATVVFLPARHKLAADQEGLKFVMTDAQPGEYHAFLVALSTQTA
jgi:hypothetical protein